MYSVVLMMTLSGGADIPDCHWRRCTGCYGSCYGSSYASCSGGYYTSCHGCHGSGGFGGYSCSGSVIWYGPAAPSVSPVPPGKAPEMPPPAKPESVPPPPKGAVGEVDAKALIQVTLPADAVLTIDGTATTSSAEYRTFVTPTLRPGVSYFYTFQAQTTRDGQQLFETQKVYVAPGQTTEVHFSSPIASKLIASQ